MWRLWSKRLLAMVIIAAIGLPLVPLETKAEVFSDAYDFFEEYGTEMVFQPGADRQGIIYYGTKGPVASTAKTRYGTVGWKITVKNGQGSVIETLYFALGGDYLAEGDSQIVDGYEYMLYKCSLPKLKSAMSVETRNALKTANCEIIFDACMVVKLSGKNQGGIADGGETWGTVYTTYDGIVNAKSWSASSKTNLKSYFNKTVTGLFYNVELSCGTGIESVSGEGKYCYGSSVIIDAEVKDGYTFASWTGSRTSKYACYGFTIYDQDISMTASATERRVSAEFYRNWNIWDTTSSSKSYTYEDIDEATLPDYGWTKEGYHQIGWSTNQEAVKPEYIKKQPITEEWIENHMPEETFYAIWYPNDYTIRYDSNGGTGSIYNPIMNYTRTLTLPGEGFEKSGCTLAGWSLYEGDNYVEYYCEEEVEIAYLVEELGLGLENNATITLYAVWDTPPVISAYDLYVTLEDAQNGVVTEEWLSKKVSATDVEDGNIPYGTNSYNSFYVMDYSPSDLTMFTRDGYVTETFIARDSTGNVAKARIKIYVVDNQIYEEDMFLGVLRFISGKYFKTSSGEWVAEDAGGLWEDSLWRNDNRYRSILEALFFCPPTARNTTN